MKRNMIAILLCLLCMAAKAQEKIKVHVQDAASSAALEQVLITGINKWLGTTDSAGDATIDLPQGTNKLLFVLTGYNKLDTVITLPGIHALTISLNSDVAAIDEVTVISSTRSNQPIENSPMKVEVLGLEELGEEAGIKPGNIAGILGDVSGVQIQQSSATSGNSNVRIQGLDGRYTQILRDGMPLYDGFSGGFGILTVPPLDLKQVELVKGSASTLYGGGAIGGLINLISRRPAFHQQVDALVNYTSLKEFNANAYMAKRNKRFGYTLFTGYTNQQAVDVSNDGLSDLPNAASIIVHPRVFYYPTDKTVVSVSYSGVFDNRKGGDMLLLQNKADAVHQYFESNSSQRHTGEYLLEHYFTGDVKLVVKGNLSSFHRDNETNTYAITGRQTSYYNEASVLVPLGGGALIAGASYVGDAYRTLKPDTALLRTFGNATAGVFGQYSLYIKDKTIVEAGLRFDAHNRYGLFVLPRVAVFHRFSAHWAARAGFGMGYKTPNPLVQQNVEYNPLQLMPPGDNVKPEISYGYNAEANYKTKLGEAASLFVNQAFFLTRITRPVIFYPDASGYIALANAAAPAISQGSDTYIKLDVHKWEFYIGYTYTDAQTATVTARTFAPLTPRNRGAFVIVKEVADHWRVGLEGSYTGAQYRYDGTATPSWFFMAAMVQRNIGKHIILVFNCENLFDYRMSRVEALYTGSVTNPVFKPLWAPIDGRVLNLSIRWKL